MRNRHRCFWQSDAPQYAGSVLGRDSAAIAISYPRHTISIDLGDLLVARSAEPVSDGPFVFAPGQVITLR